MINFFEVVKEKLHQFVENGHSKPIHLKQNQLIHDIYQALEEDKMVMLASDQKTYKGHISRYDKDRQAIFIEENKVINMIAIKDIKRLKTIERKVS